MMKKIAVYAVKHEEPPKWDFRKSEINTEGAREMIRRRVAYLHVPNNSNLFPNGANKKNRIHPPLVLCVPSRHRGRWVKLNVQEAINRFGLVPGCNEKNG